MKDSGGNKNEKNKKKAIKKNKIYHDIHTKWYNRNKKQLQQK